MLLPQFLEEAEGLGLKPVGDELPEPSITALRSPAPGQY